MLSCILLCVDLFRGWRYVVDLLMLFSCVMVLRG